MVRNPDGGLSLERRKDQPVAPQQPPKRPISTNTTVGGDIGNAVPSAALRPTTTQAKSRPADDAEIGDVWQEQLRIQKEQERLELEYKIAKKMTKELKQKLKEKEPINYDDASFSDILTPEVRDFGKRLKPYTDKAKDAAQSVARTTAKRTKILTRITGRRVKSLSAVTATEAKKLKNLKNLKKPQIKRPAKLDIKRAALLVPVFVVVAGVVVVIKQRNNGQQAVKSAVASQSAGEGSSLPRNQTPEFDTVLPKGKTAEQLGGFARISPGDKDPVYGFADTYQGYLINITQQKMPSTFKGNEEAKLEEIAKSYQANSIIQIDENRVYHGYAQNAKVQSLIFIKNDLLIFIRSPQKLSDEAWASYIIALE
jgi:hypothetical protein